MNIQDLSPFAMLRISELSSTKTKKGLLPFSHSTIRRLEKAGNFPKHVRIGKSRIYIAKEVQAWVEGFNQGVSHDEKF